LCTTWIYSTQSVLCVEGSSHIASFPGTPPYSHTGWRPGNLGAGWRPGSLGAGRRPGNLGAEQRPGAWGLGGGQGTWGLSRGREPGGWVESREPGSWAEAREGTWGLGGGLGAWELGGDQGTKEMGKGQGTLQSCQYIEQPSSLTVKCHVHRKLSYWARGYGYEAELQLEVPYQNCGWIECIRNVRQPETPFMNPAYS